LVVAGVSGPKKMYYTYFSKYIIAINNLHEI
jgi:hypothetical protein